MLDKRTQNSTVNKERTIINLKNSLQETRGCCSAAGSFVLLTVLHPFFFFFLPFFGFQDKHWGRGRQWCLSWHCSHTLQSEKLRNGRDSMFPAGCSGDLKTCLCQVSERPPGLVTPPHSLLPCLPLKAARRSRAEVQACVGGCSRCCWQWHGATCPSLASTPSSPEIEPGLQRAAPAGASHQAGPAAT